MNIVYASNENYVKHMAASMVSVFEQNKKEKKLVVYVLSIGIKMDSRAKLESMAKRYCREIKWIELDNIRSYFDFRVYTRGFDISAMGRLFVGRLLPEKIQRVLYLDCDTVVVQPFGKLWRMDLKGKLVGAVMEPTIYREVKQEIGLGEQDPYVNSGVLLIDLRKWRKQDAEGRLLAFYRSRGGSLFACDQDTINGALKGEILFLPPKYNFFTNYRYFSYRELTWYSKTYELAGKAAFQEAKRCPVIIHYMGDERPWIKGNRNHYRKYYEQALALTPWAGEEKEKGKEWYMLAYHLMDYVTVICPPIRRMISRSLGMKAIEGRKGISSDGSSGVWDREMPEDQKNSVKEKDPKIMESDGKEGKKGQEYKVREQILVLLASFQGAAYIEEQLDSILAQTVPGIQIMVSDDGSDDGTREILDRYQRLYPDRIILKHRVKDGRFQDGKKQIPKSAMNFFWLLSQADADYVLLSDQDDKWHPYKVERLLRRMKQIEKPGCPALVFSDMQVVDDKLKLISPSFFQYAHSNPDRLSFSELLVENPITGGAMMMNKTLTEMGGRVPDACFMHDWWIGLCASCFGEISCVKEPLSLYRQHGHNVLGARKTGSLEDLKERSVRGEQVRENYCQMLGQARAFGKMFGKRLTESQRQVLKAFLKLPGKMPPGRLVSIVRNRFYKSSWIQTLAQCVTIPRKGCP